MIKEFPSSFSTLDKIEFLERQIVICSIDYYENNRNVLSDREYDERSKQLVALIKENPEEAAKSKCAYIFDDFDGSTGFDLRGRLSGEDNKYLTHLAGVFYKASQGLGTRASIKQNNAPAIDEELSGGEYDEY